MNTIQNNVHNIIFGIMNNIDSNINNKLIQEINNDIKLFNDFINDKYILETIEFNNDIKQTIYDLIEHIQKPNIQILCIQHNLYFDTNLFFIKLTNCNCCIRHFNNRPKTISDYQIYPITNSYNNICKCNCRHTIRWLCRLCGDCESTGVSYNVNFNDFESTGINI